MKPITIVAHRGLTARYPENTLEAIDAAFAFTRYIEIDVQLTNDNELVVFHDRKLEHLTKLKGKTSEYSLNSLQNTSISQLNSNGLLISAPFLTADSLSNWLKANPDCHLFVEAKRIAIDDSSPLRVYQRIEAIFGSLANQVTLISYNSEIIALAARQKLFSTGIIIEYWQEITTDTSVENYDYVFIDADIIPADYRHQIEQPIWVVFEVGTPAQAIELIEQGFSWLETFDCEKLTSFIRDPANGL